MLALVFSSSIISTPALADTVEASDPSEVFDQNLSAEERQALLARLSDEQVRDIVWNLIGDSQSESASSDPVVMELATITNDFREGLAERFRQIPVITRVPGIVATAMTPPGESAGTFWLVMAYIVGILLVGWLTQYLFKKAAKRIPEALSAASQHTFPCHLARRFGLLICDLFPPAVFAVSACIVFLLAYRGHEPNRLLMMGLIAATSSLLGCSIKLSICLLA